MQVVKTVAVIPVRMDSTRLSGKVMMPVGGQPLIGHLLDRVEKCKLLDEVVVATSVNSRNDVIESYCRDRNTICYRGSEDDVLERILLALEWREAKYGALIFGDCPLIDPAIITSVVSEFLQDLNYDFVGNDLRTTYPAGMEVEVFRVDSLRDSGERCEDTNIREHSTLYIRIHPEIYNLKNIEAPDALTRPDLFLEVDTAVDLRVVRTIVTHFAERKDYTLGEIIDYITANPEISRLNRDVHRRWKQYRT